MSLYAGSKRRMKPTVTSFLPALRSASMIAMQSSAVVARGFSHRTYVPASMALMTSGAWTLPKVAMITASTSGSFTSSSEVS